MKNRLLLLPVTMLVFGLHANAQRVQNFRASITGGGDHGKCTIEVNVDDTAEVEIYGTEGRLRTFSGSPATWRRFQCNEPMPRNPGDFRFRGIDGRGRVELVRDPRDNGGRAIVRIQDSKGGREGYTFDLEWRGGGGGYPGGGFPSGGNRGDGYPGGGGGNRYTAAQALNVCRNAVRDRAFRDYGVKEVDFTSINPDNNPGRNDWIVGTFDGRGGRNRDRYSFACSVNFSNGNVRSVDIRRR
ncbi:MAG: hypothetical protein ABJF23_09870 [Bryobacteraceae bacterium]